MHSLAEELHSKFIDVNRVILQSFAPVVSWKLLCDRENTWDIWVCMCVCAITLLLTYGNTFNDFYNVLSLTVLLRSWYIYIYSSAPGLKPKNLQAGIPVSEVISVLYFFICALKKISLINTRMVRCKYKGHSQELLWNFSLIYLSYTYMRPFCNDKDHLEHFTLQEGNLTSEASLISDSSQEI